MGKIRPKLGIWSPNRLSNGSSITQPTMSNIQRC
jgi:hypothetical protein